MNITINTKKVVVCADFPTMKLLLETEAYYIGLGFKTVSIDTQKKLLKMVKYED